MIDNGRLACKVKSVYEHRVVVESLNDYNMTKQLSMAIPGAKIDAPLISERDLTFLQEFVSNNPEIEYISLPRVQNITDVSNMKRKLDSVNEGGRIKFLSKI